MRPLFKIGVLFGIFVALAGMAAYLTLRLIVQSEDVVVVPDLVGKDLVYALGIGTDLGLNIKVSGFEYRADIAKNHVAYQEPKAGAEVKKGRDVRIIVCKGAQTVIVPNFVGADVRQANIIMEENGLAEGVVSRTYSERAIRGEVISQVPAPGGAINRGSAIDLLISLGRRPVNFKMPYLDGLSLEDAILILERSQLKVGQIRHVERDDLPKDVVVGQDPLSGYPVASGILVNLTINRSEKGPVFHTGLHLFHYCVPAGFLRKHVRLRVNAFGMLYDLFDVFEKAGDEIWMLLPKHCETTFFLYEDGELVLSHSFASRSENPSIREIEMEQL
jgi:serine/threonine-protein kinase